MALSDERLAALAREYTEIKTEIKDFEAERAPRLAKIKQRILAEMQRQGRKSLDTQGVKITYVQAEKVEYDLTKLRRVLKDAPDVLDRVIIESINRPALESEIEAGNITPRQVARFATTKQNAPYISVT